MVDAPARRPADCCAAAADKRGRMAVQIYSMTSVADAVATAEAGADLIGLVVAEPGLVAEAIGADSAREILAAIRPRSRGVALSLSDDRDEMCAMVDAVRPDVLHVVARDRARGLRVDSPTHRARHAPARDRSARR